MLLKLGSVYTVPLVSHVAMVTGSLTPMWDESYTTPWRVCYTLATGLSSEFFGAPYIVGTRAFCPGLDPVSDRPTCIHHVCMCTFCLCTGRRSVLIVSPPPLEYITHSLLPSANAAGCHHVVDHGQFFLLYAIPGYSSFDLT